MRQAVSVCDVIHRAGFMSWQRSTRANLLPLFMVRSKLQVLVYDIEERYRKAKFGGILRASFSGTFLQRIGHVCKPLLGAWLGGWVRERTSRMTLPYAKRFFCRLNIDAKPANPNSHTPSLSLFIFFFFFFFQLGPNGGPPWGWGPPSLTTPSAAVSFFLVFFTY